MTGVTADVLASIDGALAAYGSVGYGDTGDQMRWRPESPELAICHGNAPLWPATPSALRLEYEEKAGYTVTAHYRTSEGLNVCVRVTVYSEADRAKTARRMASARRPHPGWRPRPASRCEDCNPNGNPGALAVDGDAYQRRLKTRRRRRNR